MKVVSAVLADDRAAIDKALRDRFQNHTERTDFYIDIIRRSVAKGLKPSSGGGQQPDGSRRAAASSNPKSIDCPPEDFACASGVDKIVLKINKPAVLRLDWQALQPERPVGKKPTLARRQPNGQIQRLEEGATWTPKSVEWQADAGEYEIRRQ